MRALIVILTLSVVAVVMEHASATPKPGAPKPEDAVLATTRQLVDAMGNKNVAVLKHIIADDFVGVGAGGAHRKQSPDVGLS